MVETSSQAHTLEECRRHFLRTGNLPPQFQWNQHILQRGQRREKVERLEDETYAFRTERCPSIFGEVEDVFSIEQDPA